MFAFWLIQHASGRHKYGNVDYFHVFSHLEQVDHVGSDPMMVLVLPKEQYSNSYTFTTPTDGYNNIYRYSVCCYSPMPCCVLFETGPAFDKISFFMYCLFSCLHMKNIHLNDVQAIISKKRIIK